MGNKSEFYRGIFTLFYLTNEVMKMNPIAFDSNSLPEEIKIAKMQTNYMVKK